MKLKSPYTLYFGTALFHAGAGLGFYSWLSTVTLSYSLIVVCWMSFIVSNVFIVAGICWLIRARIGSSLNTSKWILLILGYLGICAVPVLGYFLDPRLKGGSVEFFWGTILTIGAGTIACAYMAKESSNRIIE